VTTNFVKKALLALTIGLTSFALNAMDYRDLNNTSDQIIRYVIENLGNKGIVSRITNSNGTIASSSFLW
jgi:hypothetical protein